MEQNCRYRSFFDDIHGHIRFSRLDPKRVSTWNVSLFLPNAPAVRIQKLHQCPLVPKRLAFGSDFAQQCFLTLQSYFDEQAQSFYIPFRPQAVNCGPRGVWYVIGQALDPVLPGTSVPSHVRESFRCSGNKNRPVLTLHGAMV
jgi:hypothetical protein